MSQLYRTSKTTTTVASKLTHAEVADLDEIVKDSQTNRSTVLREAFLWASQDEEFLRVLSQVKLKNGRAR